LAPTIVGDGSLRQPGVQRQAPVERKLEVGHDAVPRCLVAIRIDDPKSGERAPRLARVRRGLQHVETLERERARDSTEHAGTVGGHHRQLVSLDFDVLISALEPRQLRRCRELLHRSRAGKVRTQSPRHPNDQRIHQLCLPRPPRRRPGRPPIGLGECGEQPEPVDRADRGDDPIDGRGIVEVAPRGDIGQQQMVFDQ
jgi:hypothetical protein